MAKTLAKPQLRNGGKRTWGIALGISILASCSFAVWYKKRVLEPRKKHYRDFYDQWDDDKEFAAMQKAGIFKGFEPS